MRLRVPPQYHKALSDLMALSAQTLDGLTNALESAPPALYLNKLSTHVAKEAKLDRAKTAGIMRVLTSLYSARAQEGIPISEFVEDLFLALKDTKRKELEPKDGDWQRVKSALERILSCEESLGTTSKALSVMVQHGRIFKGAQILTDIRPVFHSDPKKTPAATVLVHTLKIDFLENGEPKSYFVALDSRDLDILQGVLDRARAKQITLKKVIEETGIAYLDPDSN